MPVGLYVNNSGNEAAFKNVLSQIYTSSSPSSSLSPSCSSVSSSSSSCSSDSRLDSRPVVFVVLTQNELNNLHSSKLNLHFVDSTNTTTTTINKENSNDQVSQIDDDQIKYLLDEHNLIEHHHHHQHHHNHQQQQQQQQEEPTTTKNNIDYAIDAVLAKCRQESREPSVDSIPSVHSETKTAKSKLCKTKAGDVESEQQSKSSKARTSYISSLIASRQKSVDDKQPVDGKTKSGAPSLLSSKSQPKSSQVLIQPKPVSKPRPAADFVLSNASSSLSRLLANSAAPAVCQPLDYDSLEQSMCHTDRLHLKLVELKSRPVKKSKPKRPLDHMPALTHQLSRPKKLKTIADIVKHQATTNQHNVHQHQEQQQEQHQEQQQEQQQERQTEESGSEDLTMTWINQNHLINSMQYAAESEQLSMDNLLELELSTEESSPIDKFIDLDEIDVNPLDYRCGAHMVCSQMDEFNVQFSVCSSGSSGFSEPSNFSCSSSISGASGSNLGYGNCGASVLSVNSVNNLFSPEDSSPCAYQSYEHNSPYPNAYTIGGAQHLTLDWNMIDLAADKASESGASSSAVTCGDNVFANFNFFNDEIKLEI